MKPEPAPAFGRRTMFSRTPSLRPFLIWVIVTSSSYAFLPNSIWGTVRWVLAAALLIEVILLALRKLRSQA